MREQLEQQMAAAHELQQARDTAEAAAAQMEADVATTQEQAARYQQQAAEIEMYKQQLQEVGWWVWRAEGRAACWARGHVEQHVRFPVWLASWFLSSMWSVHAHAGSRRALGSWRLSLKKTIYYLQHQLQRIKAV